MSTQPLVSVVIPLFNEEGNLPALLAELIPTLEDEHLSFEVVLVDDGSADATWDRIIEAHHRDVRIKGLHFVRNFGHQNALMAGLEVASGAAIVTLDGDLQHPPSLIPTLVERWRRGFKVVCTVRIDGRETGAFKRATSRWFYRVFSMVSGLPLSPGSSDFRLIDRSVADAMISMQDVHLFLRGFVEWASYPTARVEYEVRPRYAGATKFSVLRMVRFSIAAMVSFSSLPLRIGVWIGLSTSVLAVMELAYIVWEWWMGRTVPGWASVLTVISFMFGVLFVLVGIIGTYLSDIHEMLKKRPRFIVGERVGELEAGRG